MQKFILLLLETKTGHTLIEIEMKCAIKVAREFVAKFVFKQGIFNGKNSQTSENPTSSLLMLMEEQIERDQIKKKKL